MGTSGPQGRVSADERRSVVRRAARGGRGRSVALLRVRQRGRRAGDGTGAAGRARRVARTFRPTTATLTRVPPFLPRDLGVVVGAKRVLSRERATTTPRSREGNEALRRPAARHDRRSTGPDVRAAAATVAEPAPTQHPRRRRPPRTGH